MVTGPLYPRLLSGYLVLATPEDMEDVRVKRVGCNNNNLFIWFLLKEHALPKYEYLTDSALEQAVTSRPKKTKMARTRESDF